MLCKNCGITLPYNTVKCPKCGADLHLRKDIKIFAQEPEKPALTGKILILFILLIITGATIYFALSTISKHVTGTELIQTSQTIYEESSSGNTQELINERVVDETAPPPDATSNFTTESPAKEDVRHQRTKDNKKTRELTEMESHIEQGFRQKEGSHFIVKFEGGENADIAHLISIIMEEAYMKVGSDIGYYPEDRIGAVLYTQQQFTDVTRAPSWVGAIYDGRIKIPVGGITSRTNLLEKVLFHEYAHAIVHRLSHGKAPVWLNEGIAQYVEGTVNENINEVLSFVAKSEKAPPLRVFEGSFMGFNTAQAMVAYSVSLSATEYIINEFGMSAVKRILENIGQGKTLEKAISDSLYISYEDLQKNWFGAVKRRFAG